MTKKALSAARKAKNDEFYTQLHDIESEIASLVNISSNPQYHRNPFEGKTILCNCDDPTVSNFFFFFSRQFERLKLKKLITTCYKNQNPNAFSLPLFQDSGLEEPEGERKTLRKGLLLEYDGTKNGNSIPSPEEIGVYSLEGDGDFRSPECIEILKQADIVVTNPPFSLFREFVSQIMTYDKKFLILGNKNAISYKEIFCLFKENKIWIGNRPMGKDILFDVPEKYANSLVKNKREGSSYKIVNGKVKGRASAVWYTNIEHNKRNEELILWKEFNNKEYLKYDNYDAINVDRVTDIPNYDGLMGVPITFLDKYNPSQFEIVGSHRDTEEKCFYVDGKAKFARLLIKRKT